MDMNLFEAIKDRKSYLKEKKIKLYAFQLLKALQYMHKSGIFHRDIKPENILLKEDHLVLADLGSCKGIYSKPPFTEYVSTRWYRAPECIMTNGYYNYKMDMWGVGCVLFEITTLFPLFPGDNELDQMQKIQNILGCPSQEVMNQYKKCSFDHVNEINISFNKKGCGINKYMPHSSPEFIDLIMKMLNYNPEERYSAKQALQHPFFKDLVESNSTANNNSQKMPIGMNTNQTTIMKSFINESLSIIKSTEESQNNIIIKKKGKENKIPPYLLPCVKRSNGDQHSNRSGNDSYSEENSLQQQQQQQKIKLPKLGKLKFNNVPVENKNNSILEYNNNNNNNNCTQYLKGVSMSKKMNMLKQKYVSPYSQKVIFNMPKH